LFKTLFLLFFFSPFLLANVYYAKVEPYEVRDILSNAAGQVLFTQEDMIGQKLSQKPFIQIDDALNHDELQSVREKMQYLRENLQTDKKIVINLQEALQRKKENFARVQSLSIKSKVEKDREFYDVVASEDSYLTILKEMNSLKANISDLELREKQLEKMIEDKSISAEGYILYSIKVKPESVVNVGTPLARVADTSKALLTIYLDRDDVQNLDKRVLYINGKKSSSKIVRVHTIADEKNISRYKAQIVIQAPKVFSQLVKIELKGKSDESR
jgi:hypothetical protein